MFPLAESLSELEQAQAREELTLNMPVFDKDLPEEDDIFVH
jgi:hypothetical protein